MGGGVVFFRAARIDVYREECALSLAALAALLCSPWDPRAPDSQLLLPPFASVQRYFVAEEIGVNYTLHRHFSWPHNVLDPLLLAGIPTAVVLSELDTYVPSLAVSRHLAHRAPHVAVHMLKGHAHSQFCVSKEGLQAVLAAILETDAHVR